MIEKLDKKFEAGAIVTACIMQFFFMFYLYALTDYYFNIYPVIINKGFILMFWALLTVECIGIGNAEYSRYKIKTLDPKQYYECGGRIG